MKGIKNMRKINPKEVTGEIDTYQDATDPLQETDKALNSELDLTAGEYANVFRAFYTGKPDKAGFQFIVHCDFCSKSLYNGKPLSAQTLNYINFAKRLINNNPKVVPLTIGNRAPEFFSDVFNQINKQCPRGINIMSPLEAKLNEVPKEEIKSEFRLHKDSHVPITSSAYSNSLDAGVYSKHKNTNVLKDDKIAKSYDISKLHEIEYTISNISSIYKFKAGEQK